jgi:ribosomal-protein-alanine N-acetyltransferase
MAISLEHSIRTPRLTLRRMTAADAPRVYEIQSNWNVTRMLRMASFPPTLDELHHWLAQHEGEWLSGTAYRFALVAEERIIGCADVDEIASDSGDLGYWLDEAYWGRGLASEAAGAVRDFALGTVGLKRILSGHAADNPASGRVLAKLGFRWIRDARSWSRSRQEAIIHRKYEFVSTATAAAAQS